MISTVLTAAVLAFVADGETAGVGKVVPDHEFAPIVNHDGRTRLSELYGQPVLLVGWRGNFNDGVQGLVSPFELVKKYDEGDLLLLLENRNAWRTDTQWAGELAFLFTQFPSLRRSWVTSNPDADGGKDVPVARTVGRSLQSLVLIGVDGTLLLEGEGEETADRLAKLIAAEVARRQKGWGKDKAAIKARSLAFGKDKLAKAWDALEAADEAPSEEREIVRAELERHFAARLKSVRFLLAEGRYLDATQHVDALRTSTKGHATWSAALEPLAAELASPEAKREHNLDKKLAKIIKGLWDETVADPKLLEALRAFAEKNASSRVGARAKRLLPLVENMVIVVYGRDAVR